MLCNEKEREKRTTRRQLVRNIIISSCRQEILSTIKLIIIYCSRRLIRPKRQEPRKSKKKKNYGIINYHHPCNIPISSVPLRLHNTIRVKTPSQVKNLQLDKYNNHMYINDSGILSCTIKRVMRVKKM